MKDKEYYSIKELASQQAQWNWLFGERSNGKSYQVKELALTDAILHGRLLAYVRREREDIKVVAVNDYFADINIRKISNGEGEFIDAYRDGLYLAKNVDDKVKRVRKIGNYFCLSGEHHYKSRAYPDIYHVIFEEAITNKGYLYEEPTMLQNLVSTILRKRDGRVWLIGNTISQDCPYFAEWHLSHIYRQKQGTIELYHKEDGVTIACEYCGSAARKSGMFFGKTREHIEHGTWDTHTYPILHNYDEYTHLYDIYFRFNGMVWYKAELLRRKGNKCVLFVHPHTRGFEDGERYRIIDSSIDTFNETDSLVTRNFKSVTRADEVVKSVIADDMVYFSDDLTGENFYIHKRNGGFM